MNRVIAKICRRLLLGQLIGMVLLLAIDTGYYLAYYRRHLSALYLAGVNQGSQLGIDLITPWWVIGVGALIAGLVLGLAVYSYKLNGRYLVPASLTNPLETRVAAELFVLALLGLMMVLIVTYLSAFVVLLFLTPSH